MISEPQSSPGRSDLISNMHNFVVKEEGKDDEDFRGFCVFGGKMTLFGYNGLYVTDIDMRTVSAHKSIRYFNNTVVSPVSTRLVAPVINWFYKRL